MRANVSYPKLAVRVVASQKLPDRLLVSNYVAIMKNLNGQVSMTKIIEGGFSRDFCFRPMSA